MFVINVNKNKKNKRPKIPKIFLSFSGVICVCVHKLVNSLELSFSPQIIYYFLRIPNPRKFIFIEQNFVNIYFTCISQRISDRRGNFEEKL